MSNSLGIERFLQSSVAGRVRSFDGADCVHAAHAIVDESLSWEVCSRALLSSLFLDVTGRRLSSSYDRIVLGAAMLAVSGPQFACIDAELSYAAVRNGERSYGIPPRPFVDELVAGGMDALNALAETAQLLAIELVDEPAEGRNADQRRALVNHRRVSIDELLGSDSAPEEVPDLSVMIWTPRSRRGDEQRRQMLYLTLVMLQFRVATFSHAQLL